MKTLFLKALTVILFASFVLPAGYELSSQQDPNTKVQQKDRQRLRDGSCGVKKKHKKKHKKIKKNKKIRKGRT